jgi:hypothetical protein
VYDRAGCEDWEEISRIAAENQQVACLKYALQQLGVSVRADEENASSPSDDEDDALSTEESEEEEGQKEKKQQEVEEDGEEEVEGEDEEQDHGDNGEDDADEVAEEGPQLKVLYLAALAGDLEYLRDLHRTGHPWSTQGFEVVGGLRSGNPEVVRFCLAHMPRSAYLEFSGRPHPNIHRNTNAECLQVLYDHGYLQLLSPDVGDSPVYLAIWGENLPCLKVIRRFRGGPLPDERECVNLAVQAGAEMLRYVRGMGFPWGAGAATNAVLSGDVGLVRYVLENGGCAPCTTNLVEEAIHSGSIDCLRLVHEHAQACGCSRHWEFVKAVRNESGSLRQRPVARNVETLRYVWAHMDREFASVVSMVTARDLDKQMRDTACKQAPDLQMVLYLDWLFESGQVLEAHIRACPLPTLRKVAEGLRERAIALERVFFIAEKLAQEGPGQSSDFFALRDVMGRIPVELRERIAIEAHLAIPLPWTNPKSLCLCQ